MISRWQMTRTRPAPSAMGAAMIGTGSASVTIARVAMARFGVVQSVVCGSATGRVNAWDQASPHC